MKLTLNRRLPALPMGKQTVTFEKITFNAEANRVLVHFKGYEPLWFRPDDYQLSNFVSQLGIEFENNAEIAFEDINAYTGKSITYSRYTKTIEETMSGQELIDFEEKYGRASYIEIIKKEDERSALVRKTFININFNLDTIPKEV